MFAQNLQIVIEGERKEYRGDAAIDDVTLSGCMSQPASIAMTSSSETSLASTASPHQALTVPFINMTSLQGNRVQLCMFSLLFILSKQQMNWRIGHVALIDAQKSFSESDKREKLSMSTARQLSHAYQILDLILLCSNHFWWLFRNLQSLKIKRKLD